MSKLVVFGDSWVCGAGNDAPPGVHSSYAFGSQLASLLDINQYTNCGIEGSSNSRSVLQLLKYTSEQSDLTDHIAIFFITAPERTCVIDHHNKIHDIYSGPDTDLVKSYVNFFCSTQQLKFECCKNILAMQQVCKHYGIIDYYIVGWSDITIDFPGINLLKFFPKTAAQIIGYKNNHDFVNAPRNQYTTSCMHPNKLGHELIAKELQQWLLQQDDVNNLLKRHDDHSH